MIFLRDTAFVFFLCFSVSIRKDLERWDPLYLDGFYTLNYATLIVSFEYNLVEIYRNILSFGREQKLIQLRRNSLVEENINFSGNIVNSKIWK